MKQTGLVDYNGNPIGSGNPLPVQVSTAPTVALPVSLQPGPSSGTIGQAGSVVTYTDTVLFTMSIGSAIQNKLWGWNYSGVAYATAAANSPLIQDFRFSLKGVTSGKILVLAIDKVSNETAALTTGTAYYYAVSGSQSLAAPIPLLQVFPSDTQLQGIVENAGSATSNTNFRSELNLFTSVN